MTIKQTREMSPKIFCSLSEETKIRMHNLQFQFDAKEWDDVVEWVNQNINNAYTIETDSTATSKATNYWIFFYDEKDATAFKLRWI